MAPAIDGHCKHDQCVNDDFLNVVGPTHLLTAVAQEGHDERANHRTQDAALAAAQAAATTHDRRYDVEFQSHRDRWIALAQTRHLHYAGQAKQQTREAIDVNLQTIGRDTTRARRSFIGSQREDTASKNSPTKHYRRGNSK